MTLLAMDGTAGELARLFGVQLVTIFYQVVLPILLIAAIGHALQWRFRLDPATLTRMNLYFVVPGLVYYALVSAEVTAGQVGTAVGFGVAMVLGLLLVSNVVARLRGLPPDQRRVMMMTVTFYNSGNYGLPLQSLAFRRHGLEETAFALQTVLTIVQNVSNFTLGIVLAASGRRDRHWRENLLAIAKFPPLYALAAALITIQVRAHLSPAQAERVAPYVAPFWIAVSHVGRAMVAVALFTLGAQLAAVRRIAHAYPVKVSVLLRLLGGPALGLELIYLLMAIGRPVDPFVAQVLLISTSTPTAVNCMLLCMEFDNHPDYAARVVLYSTLLSPITVTLVVFLAQSNLLPGFRMG